MQEEVKHVGVLLSLSRRSASEFRGLKTVVAAWAAMGGCVDPATVWHTPDMCAAGVVCNQRSL